MSEREQAASGVLSQEVSDAFATLEIVLPGTGEQST
jgi:hypothetical protein